MYQEGEEGGKWYTRDGYKVENREECDTYGKQKGICIRKEKRKKSHVMDTRWRTEMNVIQRGNR